MVAVFCCRELGDGTPCWRLDGKCPIHDDAPAPAEKPARSGKFSDLLHEMTERVVDGTASPTLVTRLARGITAMEKIPLSPQEVAAQEDRSLAIMELSASFMIGIAPKDAEEWELAIEEWGIETVLESMRFWRPDPWSEPIPISVTERILDLAEKKNYPPFRIASAMLNPASRPGEPFQPALPYPRIDHDPGGWMGPREVCEDNRWNWHDQGVKNGVMFWDTGANGEKVGRWIDQPRLVNGKEPEQPEEPEDELGFEPPRNR